MARGQRQHGTYASATPGKSSCEPIDPGGEMVARLNLAAAVGIVAAVSVIAAVSVVAAVAPVVTAVAAPVVAAGVAVARVETSAQ